MSKKMMALLSIVEEGKGKKLIKTLEKQQIWLNFQMVGQGTAPTEMLDIFGLGSNDKDIVISLGAACDVQDMVGRFDETIQSGSKYGGIMVVLNVAAAGRVLNEILNFNTNQNGEKETVTMQNDHHNCLIVISVNEGYSEAAMQVTRKAGATGGTIIKGRLADVEQFSEFVPAEMDGEREMLCILAPAKTAKTIMEEVNQAFGLTSPANGIIFALPTEKAFKI